MKLKNKSVQKATEYLKQALKENPKNIKAEYLLKNKLSSSSY